MNPENDMSRREFGRLLVGGAALLGGAAVLGGCGHPHSIEAGEAPAVEPGLVDVNINGAAEGPYQPALQLNPREPRMNPNQDIRELFMPGGLYRTFPVGGQKLVTITLDDGPWPTNTLAIANTLRDNDLEGCATLFQVADNVRQFREIAQEAAARGYLIASHAKTHNTYVPRELAAEIPLAQDIFYEFLGLRPDLFRSPGLTQGQVIQDMLASLGMCNIFTDVDLNDWTSPRISSQQIINNVENNLHPGLVILLHDGGSHTQTVNAMQGIIDVIRKHDYTIVTMKQMMQAAQGAVFTNRLVEKYVARASVPDFSNDKFNRTQELADIGLVAA